MRAVTHLAFAGLTGVVIAGFGADIGVMGSAALGVGALVPDIDTQHSGLGRMIKPLSSKLERSVGHRTLTHSFLGMFIVGGLFSWLLLVNPAALIWLLVGMFSHILLDTANIVGVPLLYPYRLQFWLVSNRAWRVPYNSPKEFSWLGVISLLAVCLMPLSIDGFSPWFHRALGTPYGAVEDYLLWREDFEVWADITGHNLLTNEDINGRYRVIDALHDELILVEDSAGRAFTVGLGQTANIHSNRLTVWKGEKIVTSTYRLDLAGRLVRDLIHSLPKGAKSIHLNAALKLKGEADTAPVIGYFERVQKQGDEFKLRSATIGDLAPLSHLVIEGGSAVIRAAYSEGSEVLTDLTVLSSVSQVKSHVLSIPNLPSLAGLVIEVGDRVEQGEMIARYIDDEALADSQEAIDQAKARLPKLEEALKLEQEAFEVRLASLKLALEEAQAKQERTAYLVERNAEPRANLVTVNSRLRQAEEAILTQTTSWTSQKNKLELAIQEAHLTLTQAEKKKTKDMQEQWVKAPLAGLISDIRLVKVTTTGVDLEVMILEEVGDDEWVGEVGE